MTDNRIYRTRTLGIPAEGMRDQYADGTAAKLWELYIGDKNQRTTVYRDFITNLLREKKCKTVLDVACGTGVDSIMLVEAGFKVHSVDLSDKMLKYALKTRWKRRKEPSFDQWVIEEANWLTLIEDIGSWGTFDAVVCLGNSFAHLPNASGDQEEHRIALENFAKMVKPGGILVIDHRNYDYIVQNGRAPSHNIYYNSKHIKGIKTSVIYVEGKPNLVTLDYNMVLEGDPAQNSSTANSNSGASSSNDMRNNFRLSYFPHLVSDFGNLLKEAFGEGCTHKVYGDFKPIGQMENPGFYIHVVEKKF